MNKPIFIGECDGRPLKVKYLWTGVNKKGQPYYSFWVPFYYTEWDGSKVEFDRFKIQCKGKCDLAEGDVVYLTDFPKGKWIAIDRHRKNDGTYTIIRTIFANVSREKPNRAMLKERRNEDDE